MRLLLLAFPLLLLTSCKTLFGPKGPELLWADEFDGHEPPDGSKWAYDIGGKGWGNNELQHYTNRPENVRLLSGKLMIEAHKEDYEGNKYTSARVVTRGKHEFLPGTRIIVRAKLPAGRGTWPAIWMLGGNIKEAGWPLCGEIDIMEHVGYAPDTVYSTVHTKAVNHIIGNAKSGTATAIDYETNFHEYRLDWHEDRLEFFVDGRRMHVYPKIEGATAEQWPFDKPQYLLLNLAVGGNWGGRNGVDETIWPQRLEVDWVRAFKIKD